MANTSDLSDEYVVPFFFDTGVFLFNPLTMEKAVCSQDDFFSGVARANLPSVFVSKEKALAELAAKKAKQPQVRIAYFLLTDACNFGCKYCFIEEAFDQYPSNMMPVQTAEKAADFVLSCPGASKIIFYGGEPLLNTLAMRAVLEKVKKFNEEKSHGKRVTASLVTNGSLVTDEIAEMLKDFNVGVGVSIDGMKEAHDKMRVTRASTPTFESVVNGWWMLKKHGVEPSISFTIGSHNINDLERHVEWVCLELKPRAIGFNPQNIIPGKENPADVSPDVVARKIIEASLIAKKYGVHEDRFYKRRVESFVRKKFWVKDCSGCGNEIAVAPDGSIGPCHAFISSKQNFTMMPANEEALVQNPIWAEWNKRCPANTKYCLDCPAISICGGGCPYYSFVTAGSIWNIDERICVLANHALSWLVREAYAAKTGDRPAVMLRRPMPGDASRFEDFARTVQADSLTTHAHVERLDKRFPGAMFNLQNQGKAACYLAENDFRIVGFCNALYKDDTSAEIGIVVLKEERGKGLGLRLLEACLRTCLIDGITRADAVISKSSRHYDFFKKSGFRKSGKKPEYFVFSKSLAPTSV
ncbi:GNAT family N-acetyltransferase [archaeon]|nr:GNAT family N-acetyltransferase [archaeon]